MIVRIGHHATTPYCNGQHRIVTDGAYCHAVRFWTVVAADIAGVVDENAIGKRTREEEWRFVARGEAERWARELGVEDSVVRLADGPHRRNGWVVTQKTEVVS